MLKKEQVTDILRGGVKRIISRVTPPGRPVRKGDFQRSSHPSREFLFVISGKGEYMCNDSVYSCDAGTCFIFDSGIPHGHGYSSGYSSSLHLWGYFHERRMHMSIMAISVDGKFYNIQDMSYYFMQESLIHFIENRWNKLNMLEEVTEHDIETYMKVPINTALEEMAFRIENRSGKKHGSDAVEMLKNYIASHNGKGCSLKHLAEISNYAREYLPRKFREKAGMSTGEYIDQIRLEYIRDALKRRMRKKEIADELGFSSASSFGNWLRKHRDQL